MARIDDLIRRLAELSPMPDDSELTNEIVAEYMSLVAEIKEFKDPRTITVLVNSFGYGSGFGVYWETLRVLEEFDTASLFPMLVDCIKAGQRGARMWAAYMLGRIRSKEALDTLIMLLNDENELVRGNAAMALGMIGDEKALPYLEKLKADSAVAVRTIAEQAIYDITDKEQ